MQLSYDSSTARFILFREKLLPELNKQQERLLGMYSPVMGRPPIDPVLLFGISLLQIMERLPDRKAIDALRFDLRWRHALHLGLGEIEIHPTTLVSFRNRLLDHQLEGLVFDSLLEQMRSAGYLSKRSKVRIDSTHMLGLVAAMSRWECVKEAIRLALEFHSAFDSSHAQLERWLSVYTHTDPRETLDKPKMDSRMNQAGVDMEEILFWASTLGNAVRQSNPIILLERVWNEQFENNIMRHSVLPGGVQNPHDPEVQWSRKDTLKKEWVGFKVQICETAEPTVPNEPTKQVITAIIAQPAISSDQASLDLVIEAHGSIPISVHADAGYISGKALAKAEDLKFELIGPTLPAHQRDGRNSSDDFDFIISERKAICPNGIKSTQCSQIDETNRSVVFRFEWPKKTCAVCPLKSTCLGKNQSHRTIVVGRHHDLIQKRRREMKTELFQEMKKIRNAIEGTISECKRAFGLNKARYRGLKKVKLQAFLTAAACNLRRWSTRILWENNQSKAA